MQAGGRRAGFHADIAVCVARQRPRPVCAPGPLQLHHLADVAERGRQRRSHIGVLHDVVLQQRHVQDLASAGPLAGLQGQHLGHQRLRRGGQGGERSDSCRCGHTREDAGRYPGKSTQCMSWVAGAGKSNCCHSLSDNTGKVLGMTHQQQQWHRGACCSPSAQGCSSLAPARTGPG